MINNILSIGHNKAMNQLLKTVLAKSYQLVMVEDVFLGMYLMKHKQDIDLLIIDIDSQTKESIDLILHINSSKLYNKTIIVLSGIENQKTFKALLETHVYGYFIKPFNPIDLVNSIKELNLSASLS